MAQSIQKIEKFWYKHHVDITIASSILITCFYFIIVIITGDTSLFLVNFTIVVPGVVMTLDCRDGFISYGVMLTFSLTTFSLL